MLPRIIKDIKFEIQEIESLFDLYREELKDELSKYLIFRHFYRHSYSTHLKWEDLKKLVIPLHQVWKRFKSEVCDFMKMLESNTSQ